jgi:hypothetical protein
MSMGVQAEVEKIIEKTRYASGTACTAVIEKYGMYNRPNLM